MLYIYFGEEYIGYVNKNEIEMIKFLKEIPKIVLEEVER